MAKELGLEATSYLLHSHDRLVTDETVGGGGGQNPRNSFGIRPPTSIAGNSSPNSYRPGGGRKIYTRGVGDGGGEDAGDREENIKLNAGNDNTNVIIVQNKISGTLNNIYGKLIIVSGNK